MKQNIEKVKNRNINFKNTLNNTDIVLQNHTIDSAVYYSSPLNNQNLDLIKIIHKLFRVETYTRHSNVILTQLKSQNLP